MGFAARSSSTLGFEEFSSLAPKGNIHFGIAEEKLTLIRDENGYWNSSEKPILEVPLNKIRKEFNQDVIRIFQG